MTHALLDRLRLPAMAAPMFLVSGPDLVVECCRAGMLGTFPSLNQRTADGFGAWLAEIRRRLDGRDAAPFGVMVAVERSNARFQADLELIVRHRVPLVVTALGISREITDAIHGYGGMVFHDATTVRHAQKAIEAGVDGVIAVCGGAGGHAGTYNPFGFLAELRPLMGDRLLILSGAIGSGRAMAGAIAAGADLVSIGTALVATRESLATGEQKQMMFDARINDIVYTAELSGLAANFMASSLAPALAERRGAAQEAYDVAHEFDHKMWRDVWTAGHSVGLVSEETSVAAFCDALRADYGDAVARARAALTP